MPVSFQGKLYVLGGATTTENNGARPILELDPLLRSPKLVTTCPPGKFLGGDGSPTLQVSASEMLVVKGVDSSDRVVYRVADLVAGKMDPYVR